MVKKGDTLIEVLLAVGIFSMIAISVVAVMSGGTSSAQTALETTLAREEIDAQAEALRYIHDSYINDKNSDNTELPTVALWRTIVDSKNVYLFSDENKDEIESIIQYTPDHCPTSASELPEGAFILDTRALNLSDAVAYKSLKNEEGSVFAPATTFPRLIFSNENDLVANDISTLLTSAEGIYVIAVADKDTTTVLDIDGNPVKTGNPAFFDFYIRTCWYGTDAETPSTISTVIRLHNPDVTTSAQLFKYCIDGGICAMDRIIVRDQKNAPLDNEWPKANENPEHKGWTFDGWCVGTATGTRFEYGPGVYDYRCNGTIIPPNGGTYVTDLQNQNVTITRLFTHVKYYIKYNPNGGTISTTQQTCYEDEPCIIITEKPEMDGRKFRGWCTNAISLNSTCNGTLYGSGKEYPIIHGTTPKNTTLYATWEMHPDTVFLLDSTGSMYGMIQASRAGIKELAQRTLNLGGKVALFDYRDLSDPYPAVKERCNFGTCNLSNIVGYVDGVAVGGGGDLPESLLAALMDIMNNLQWSEDYTKSIIVVTDAGYLSPDRNGVTYAQVINKAKQLTPLNIYIVAPSSMNSTYGSMASDTGGKVIIMSGKTTEEKAKSMIDGLSGVIK